MVRTAPGDLTLGVFPTTQEDDLWAPAPRAAQAPARPCTAAPSGYVSAPRTPRPPRLSPAAPKTLQLSLRSLNPRLGPHSPLLRLKQMDIAKLRSQTAEEVLGGGAQLVAAVNNAFPHWSSGYDSEGRPVVYIEGCNYDGRFVFEVLPPETLVRYHVWRTEKTLEAYYTQRVPRGEARATGEVKKRRLFVLCLSPLCALGRGRCRSLTRVASLLALLQAGTAPGTLCSVINLQGMTMKARGGVVAGGTVFFLPSPLAREPPTPAPTPTHSTISPRRPISAARNQGLPPAHQNPR